MMSGLVPPRVASAIRYLRLYADSPDQWRISGGDCPLCGRSAFVSLRASPFMTRCFRCAANVTNLSLSPVIAKHFRGDYSGRRAYELSTFGATLKWLRRHFPDVTTSEFFPEEPLGELVNGILNQDVQHLTFADGSFDVVTSNQVMEHVPDDVQGFRECLRVLKPGGALVFSVPLRDIPATAAKATVNDDGSIQIIGEPEYHDSRLGGPRSALCFWHHSIHDISERVSGAGFSRVDLVEVTVCKAQRSPEVVVYAVK
jgi:SAM-dependent methyltransferase